MLFGGGQGNSTTGQWSTIPGRSQNIHRMYTQQFPEGNKTQHLVWVYSGGLQNTASGDASFIGGGKSNAASAPTSNSISVVWHTASAQYAT